MDCTLIRTEILRDIKKPWFMTVNEDKFLDAKNHADLWTEDLYFCKKVIEETKYSVFCDASIICQHFDIYSGKAWSIPANSLPCRRAGITKDKQAIDIGCGPLKRYDEFPEYDLLRVDIDERWEPDYRCDVRSLPFESETFDLVFSSHVLEHFDHKTVDSVLDEWIRVLKSGGTLKLVLPTIQWAAEKIVEGICDEHVMNVLYGAQTSPYDYHYNGFTPNSIKELLERHGLTNIIVNRDKWYNMVIEATK